jgi:hypothetical protein
MKSWERELKKRQVLKAAIVASSTKEGFFTDKLLREEQLPKNNDKK